MAIFFFQKKRLSQWDQKDWKKRLILLAAHVNAVGNATALLKEVDGSPNKPAIVSSATDVAKGLSTTYEILKKAYAESEAGNAPGDFTASITSPGPPPVPPANTTEATLWYQGVWTSMQAILNRVGQKCPRIADVMQSGLGPSGEKLCSDLQKDYGAATETDVRYRSMATFNAVNFPEKFVE